MTWKITLLVVAIIIAVPTTVGAWNEHQQAKPLIGYDCDDYCSGTVYVFDDQDNKCYVAQVRNTAIPGISCVKRASK